jgi:uncharacterized membrane protein YkoI
MEQKVKTIEEAEEIALNVCRAIGISVSEKDVKEIEYEKHENKWEVEIMHGDEEIEVEIRASDGTILKIERGKVDKEDDED